MKAVELLGVFCQSHVVGEGALFLAMGMVEAHQGNAEKAAVLLDKGARFAAQLDMVYTEALVAWTQAELYAVNQGR